MKMYTVPPILTIFPLSITSPIVSSTTTISPLNISSSEAYSISNALDSTKELTIEESDEDPKIDIDMIIWTGILYTTICYRTLCSNDIIKVRSFSDKPTTKIFHNDGTFMDDFSEGAIGSGNTLRMRNITSRGITAGFDKQDPHKYPVLIDPNKHCILAYDIEASFRGREYTSFNSDILCISIVCTCGHKVVISRSVTPYDGVARVTCNSNLEMTKELLRQIILHSPIFTIDHNIHAFDNIKITTALHKNSKYREFFQPTSRSISAGNTSVGLIICLPGINNFDTLRYMYKAMAPDFKGFSLGYLTKV